MKLRAFSVAVLFLFAFDIVSAQGNRSTPPPPRPAPAGHVYQGDGFTIGFPAKPIVRSERINSSFGSTERKTISLSTTFAEFIITYMDFPVLMTDRFDMNTRLDAVRDSQVGLAKGRLMKDAELIYGDYYGRDVVIENDFATLTIRTFFAGSRMFQMLVGTRGRMSAQKGNLLAANTGRVDQFFNSFRIEKLPEPPMARDDLPEDFGVSFEDGQFLSRALGLKFRYPTDWAIADEEETDLFRSVTKDELASDRRFSDYTFTDDSVRMLGIFSSSSISESSPDAILILIVERAPYPNFLPRAVSETVISRFLDRTERVVIKPTDIKFGHVDFSFVETRGDAGSLSRLYHANVNGWLFQVVAVYKKPADIIKITNALKTISEYR